MAEIVLAVVLALAPGGADAQPTDAPTPPPVSAPAYRALATVSDGSASPTLIGALAGGGMGATAGLLFVHDACDDDPCATGAYVLGAAAGAAALAGMGILIGSRARLERGARRGAWIGTAIGGALGALGGIATVAASCEDDSCGFSGYVSIAALGAGLLGGLGALIGSEVGRSDDGG